MKFLAIGRLSAMLSAMCFAGVATASGAHISAEDPVQPDGRAALQIPLQIDKFERMVVSTIGRSLEQIVRPGSSIEEEVRGAGCTTTNTLTNASFEGGQYFAQAGFAQGEIAAATYLVDPADYPIRVDLMEIIFVTVNASALTTTEWSVLVWDGDPTSGPPVATFSSDGLIVPHLIAGPGNTATNLTVLVDPGDPEQIFLFNSAGQNRFTVGFRIDKHNVPGTDPCGFGPPPSNLNAFPATDTGPLNFPGRNWLFGLNCGVFGCPPGGGWTTFQNLNIFCRPSGDWVIRATWSKVNCVPGFGACCFGDGTCAEMFSGDCNAMGGTYQGDGTTCATANCPAPTGACCNPAGGCLAGLTEPQCMAFGGIWAGPGSTCVDSNGNSIADVCESPEPEGCNPADLNTATASNPASPDWGVPDGILTPTDFTAFVTFFSSGDLRADLNTASATSPASPGFGVPDGILSPTDFSAFVSYFNAGCPCMLPGCP